jgi:hypothetical protein
LIEVDGGFCGLVSGLALVKVLAKLKDIRKNGVNASRNVPVPF